MADSKITALTSISTSTDPAVDPLVIVDVSDTSMAATGTTKKVTLNNLLSSSPTATGNFTITGALTVDTTTLVVDPTNDRVGILTASPADILEVVGSGSTGIRVSRSGALTQYATLSAGATGPTLDASSALSSLSFGIAGTTAVTINSTGNLVLKGGTAAATGVGVTFPAAQIVSSDANCLDDYEEGTWTMGLTFGGANVGLIAATTAGRYTKVGRLVTVSGYLSLTNKGSSTGRALITGLPFTIESSAASYQTASLRLDGISYGGAFQAFGTVNGTTIALEEISILGAVTDLINTDFTNSSAIMVSFTYTV